VLDFHRLGATALLVAVAITSSPANSAQPATAAGSLLEGIDVSHWQAEPRWLAVKNAGIRFVIARASFANTGRDSEYPRNRTLLRKRGIPFTAYHHAKPDATVGDAIAEANNFVDAAGLNDNNLLPVLELKTHGDLSVEMFQEWAKTWLARVEERLGVKPMIYASAAFWVEWMGNTTWFADNGYRLWIRHWGVASPTLPANDWSGHGWTLWQYGKAAVLGITSKVDRDRFNGTQLAPIRIENNR
jgi:lysozyme